MGVDEAAVAEVLVSPDPLEQLISRQDHAHVVGELAQQAELGLGQAQFPPGLQRNALLTAQFDVTEAAGRGQRRYVVQVHTAQRSADPRRQLLRDNWFRHVVVGAGLQARNEVVRVGLGRDDDDGHDAGGPQVTTYLETTHIR